MTPFLVAALVITGLAAFTDWRTGHIPNWLTLWPLGLAPFAHIVHGVVGGLHGWDAVFEGCYAMLGAALCGLVPALLYRQDGIGGGDVKLLIALGAILGWRVGFEAEMYAFFAAGLYAPARLAYEGKLFRTIRNTVLVAGNAFVPPAKRRKLDPATMTWFRFAPSIFLGTCFALILHWRV